MRGSTRQTRWVPFCVSTSPTGCDRDGVGEAVGNALRDVDARLVGVALHAEGEVHGIAPHVVHDARPTDEAARDLARVEAGAQTELDALLGVE